MGHNPELEDEFVGEGYCRACRTYWDYLEFHCCGCCPDAVASCPNDKCHGTISRVRCMDYSPSGDGLAVARRAAESRTTRQRDALRAGVR